MSSKLDRLYVAMMAEGQAEERHRAEAAKCRDRVQEISDQIKAECAEERARQQRQDELNKTLLEIALGAW